MEDQTVQPIFKNHSGKRKSERLFIYPRAEGFKFVYQKLERTNPPQSVRMTGIKPKRLVVDEQVYYISDLSKSNLDQFPFSHLLDGFTPTQQA